MKFVFGFLSGGISRKAKKNGSIYSFLFVHPDGKQFAEIGELHSEGKILPVIDKAFPFDQAKDALAYLDQGHAKGNVVVRIT